MLFKNITEIQEHIVVGAGTTFPRVKPHIASAETAYIRPLLGSSLFDELQEFYDEPPTGTLTDVQQATAELITKVQKSLIHLAYWVGFQVLNATISDGGFKRTESGNTKGLYRYQENELKDYFKTSGFNAMDEILEFIELNIEHFNEFKLSANYTIIKSMFIPDTKTFNSVIFINSSRLTFLRLKSYTTLVEDLNIRPILGDTVFDEIKSEMIKETPASKVNAILPYIQKAVAFLSTAMLIEESGADLTEKGLYFETTTAINISGDGKQPAQSEQIAALAKRNRMYGDNYLEGLKSYLNRNASDWSSYSKQSGSVLNRDNTNKKTFWS